jgi:hypothetical protein
MEQVWMKAKTSFVNRWVGSVNKKQRFLVPENIAEEFVAIGIAEYETPEVEQPKKSNPSLDSASDGMEPQSVSSPAATASRKSKSTTRKSKKTGATSQ